MNTALNLDLINIRKPKNADILKDDSENWLGFRKVRFADSSDGEYAAIRQLDLSGYDFNHFPADHIVFVQCNLNDVSFRSTKFEFGTAFINCSMKNVDFASTVATDALFIDCNLTGAKFWTKMGWSTVSLDGKKLSSVFSGCILNPETKKFLIEDGCIIDEAERAENQLDIAGEISDKLLRIVTAPILDL